MKIKEGFILREVSGQIVVLPTGSQLDLNMMITLNDTGRFLWEHLQEETNEEALVAALLEEYEVDKELAEKSVAGFVQKLRDGGLLA